MKRLLTTLALLLTVALPSVARALVPEGWPFLEFNEAVQKAKEQKKPLFVYFGFATCPYCAYLNQHTFTSEPMRKRYTANYVLAYFDIRGNPEDVIMLPGGGETTRREAIKRFGGSPVPAWMFVDPDGKTILVRRGSRTDAESFLTYDLFVASGAYRRMTFDDFLLRRGVTESGLIIR